MGMKSNFNEIDFPSIKELKRELAEKTRPVIAKRLVEVAKKKIGHQQSAETGKMSGMSVPGWAPTKNSLLKTGKIIKNRILAIVIGTNIYFGTSGNSRYGKIQRAHEYGAKVRVTEKQRRLSFLIGPGQWRKIRKDKEFLVIPERSYIRGTIFQLEEWMFKQVLKAMDKSFAKLKGK